MGPDERSIRRANDGPDLWASDTLDDPALTFQQESDSRNSGPRQAGLSAPWVDSSLFFLALLSSLLPNFFNTTRTKATHPVLELDDELWILVDHQPSCARFKSLKT
jgi:hypothetical protein